MIINEFKEGENYHYRKKFAKEDDDSEVQRIKSHLDVTYLKYVSDNVRFLLKLNVVNNNECFEKNNNYFRVIGQGDKYRVILYIRLSVEDGDVIDGDVSKSIRNQLLILLDECEKRNWIVVGIFCEEGISGADDNRPEWNKSLRFCEYGNTEIVLCKSQSRFSRSMEMIEKYLHNEFITWNIRFVGLVDSTDTSVVGNKKTRQINGLVNEWQVEDQSINIRAVLKNKQSNGLFTGAFAPYGYLKDPKDKYHFIIDEEAAKNVRMIFSMYARGMGAVKICQYLNENKIPIPSVYKHQKGMKYNCPSVEYDKRITYQIDKGDTLIAIADKHQSTVKAIMEYNSLETEQIEEGQIIIIPVIHVWRTNTIYQMLKNEVYIGTLVQHKNEIISYKNKKERSVPKDQRIVVPHCHEAIIDKDTWNIVSSRFGRTKKVRSNPDGEIPLFSGKLRCGCCDHALYRDYKERGEKVYAYWLCGNRYGTARTLCSNNKIAKESDVYELALTEINKQINLYYDKSLIEEKYYENKVANSLEDEIKILNKEKKNIEKSISKKQNTIALLYEDRANGVIDVAEFSMIKDKNSMDINNFQERLRQIEKELNNLNQKKAEKLDTEKILKKYKKIEKLNRTILDEFICKIHIGYYNPETETRNIKIDWNIDAQ